MEDDTRFELDYIAAALALMCGRFTFPDGQPHPTAAARAFGHKEISRPVAADDAQTPPFC